MLYTASTGYCSTGFKKLVKEIQEVATAVHGALQGAKEVLEDLVGCWQ